jgi:hypothetical protein
MIPDPTDSDNLSEMPDSTESDKMYNLLSAAKKRRDRARRARAPEDLDPEQIRELAAGLRAEAESFELAVPDPEHPFESREFFREVAQELRADADRMERRNSSQSASHALWRFSARYGWEEFFAGTKEECWQEIPPIPDDRPLLFRWAVRPIGSRPEPGDKGDFSVIRAARG